MPELPEVTTTVNGLKRTIIGLTFLDVWTDLTKKNPIKQFKNTLKDEKFYLNFKKEIKNKKVLKVERRAKNILIYLNNNKIILIHLKMTGHLLFGEYFFNKKENKWRPIKEEKRGLHDPFSRFVHVVFSFKNGKHLAFSDVRKFGKITLISKNELSQTIHLKNIGPEPLDLDFSYKKFKERILKRPNGKIKTVLMDQSVIAGIGNIYSDETLWLSSIHPESVVRKIPEKFFKEMYLAMRKVLKRGINFKGDSTSDYRNIDGEKGNFQNHHNVYQKKGEKCGKNNCKGVIIRKVVGGRSAHFCSKHQKLYV